MGPSINEQGEQTPYYSLQQLPKVQSALVAIDVKTGAVKAMVGGFDKLGTFNRAVQAKRQVGSSFKPFVYATAIENGYKTNSILLDAPIILRKQELDKTWKPQNYSQKVYGPSTLRLGLEKSRNLMTIRLARKIGISNIIKFAKRLGIPTENLEPNLSTALGSAAIPLIDMVSAYTIFANGGVHNKPFFIETIQNFNGETIYKNGPDCSNCRIDSNFETVPEEIENIQTQGQQIISENLAYIITDLMQGVVKRGTGWRAKKLGIPVAIKTGTTNDFIDSWYVGFTPELAVGVWSGFDNPQIMGNNETGSAVSGPTWVEFMQEAKKHYPNSNFKIPEDIVFVKVDKKTGQLPTKETKHTLLEVFENGSQPNAEKTDLMLEDESINILDGIY
jgi:penicillin-binding protein 1A